MNTPLIWPARPICHDQDYQAKTFGETKWRPVDPTPDVNGHAAFPKCSFCGSISAEALYFHLVNNPDLKLELADMKYGYPHKFYVEGIKNPHAGKQVVTGSISSKGKSTDTFGPASTNAFVKFYTQHLFDLVPETLLEFEKALAGKSLPIVIHAVMDDGRPMLQWSFHR